VPDYETILYEELEGVATEVGEPMAFTRLDAR